MEKIHFTRHARRRMKWRNISFIEVEEALLQPDKTEHFSAGRINAFRAIGTKLLRVSYVEKKDRIIAISVIDKNKQEVEHAD